MTETKILRRQYTRLSQTSPVTTHDPFDVSSTGQVVTLCRDAVSRITVTRTLWSGILVESDRFATFPVVAILGSAIQVADHVFDPAFLLLRGCLKLEVSERGR